MSDTPSIPFDPFANIDPGVPEADVRNFAADLVRSGVPEDAINGHLAARGTAPLASGSAEIAQSKLDGLMRDRAFVQGLNEGDPGATTQMQLLTLRIAQGGAKLIDRPPMAADYQFPTVGARFPNAPQEEVAALHTEYASVAASLQLRPDIAKSVVDMSLDAARRTAGMTEDERTAYGDTQAADLIKALGPDAVSRLQAASEVLTKASGRKFDLVGVARMNSTEAALTLLFQAEHLARNRK